MCLTAMFIFLLDYITDWTVLEWMLVVFFALFCIFGIILNEKEEKNKKSRKEDYKKRIVKEQEYIKNEYEKKKYLLIKNMENQTRMLLLSTEVCNQILCLSATSTGYGY